MERGNNFWGDHLVLVINRDRYKAINALITHAFERVDELKAKMEVLGLVDEFGEFIKDMSDKVHEKGWCEDPNCMEGERED